MSKRVVITGLGAITPIGIGKDAFWEGLMEGKNGIGKITRFDASEYGAQIAGEVKGFEPTDYIDKKESKRMDRYAQFAVAAAKLAIEDAGLDLEKEDRDRIGTYIGAGIGGIETMHAQYKKLFDKGPSRISPFFIPMMIANLAAGQVAERLGHKAGDQSVLVGHALDQALVADAFIDRLQGVEAVLQGQLQLAGGVLGDMHASSTRTAWWSWMRPSWKART